MTISTPTPAPAPLPASTHVRVPGTVLAPVAVVAAPSPVTDGAPAKPVVANSSKSMTMAALTRGFISGPFSRKHHLPDTESTASTMLPAGNATAAVATDDLYSAGVELKGQYEESVLNHQQTKAFHQISTSEIKPIATVKAESATSSAIANLAVTPAPSLSQSTSIGTFHQFLSLVDGTLRLHQQFLDEYSRLRKDDQLSAAVDRTEMKSFVERSNAEVEKLFALRVSMRNSSSANESVPVTAMANGQISPRPTTSVVHTNGVNHSCHPSAPAPGAASIASPLAQSPPLTTATGSGVSTVRRGRGRLHKCEKHRRWKKRCPTDCADKPLNRFALFDGDDDEDDEDEPLTGTPVKAKPAAPLTTRRKLEGDESAPAVMVNRLSITSTSSMPPPAPAAVSTSANHGVPSIHLQPQQAIVHTAMPQHYQQHMQLPLQQQGQQQMVQLSPTPLQFLPFAAQASQFTHHPSMAHHQPTHILSMDGTSQQSHMGAQAFRPMTSMFLANAQNGHQHFLYHPNPTAMNAAAAATAQFAYHHPHTQPTMQS